MNYITAISPDFYNPTYFNILESMEYELMAYEHQCMMESFNEVLLEADDMAGTAYQKPRGLAGRIYDSVKSKVKNKNGDQQLTKGQAFMQKIKTYFKIIRDKLKIILRKFMDKVDELFKLNQKFITERLYLLMGVDDKFWSGATITLYHYNRAALDSTIYTLFQCPEIDSKSAALKKLLSEKGTHDEFIKNHFHKILQHAGPKDGLKEAAKNFFRGTKSSEDKMTQFTKNDAKTQAEWSYTYLKAYKDKTARNIRDAITKLNRSMERVEKDFSTNKMIDYIQEGFISVYEETKPAPTTGDSKPINGSVQYTNGNGLTAVDPKDANHTGTEVFSRVKDYGNILMTLHTAQMTIAEEYYFSSIHVLKQLYKLADDQGFLNKEKAEAGRKELNKQAEAKSEAKKNGKNGENILKTQNKYGSA